MAIKRSRRGFERAGALPVDRLGLPGARARELVLAQAWERAAGEALAARARAVRVRRGVLEIEVDSPRWSATLTDLLPRLAGRLSRICPDLGVRRFRLIHPDSSERETPREIVDDPQADEPVAERPPPGAGREEAPAEARPATDERLEALARRYLRRGRDQNQ